MPVGMHVVELPGSLQALCASGGLRYTFIRVAAVWVEGGMMFSRKLLIIVSFVMALLTLPSAASAANFVAGKVAYVSGSVSVLRDDTLMPLEPNATIYSADIILTGNDGRTKLAMNDGSSIYIGRNSRISIEDYTLSHTSLFRGVMNLLWGKARFVVAHLNSGNASFSVRTSTAVLGVRGTNFIVSVDMPGNVAGKPAARQVTPEPMPTTVLLQDGMLSVKAVAKRGETLLNAGRMAVVSKTGDITVRPFSREDLDLFGSGLSDAAAGTVAPPAPIQPKVTVPVVVQPATVQMGTVVIQTRGGVTGQTAPTTIQVPVSVQPPVITQVPAN